MVPQELRCRAASTHARVGSSQNNTALQERRRSATIKVELTGGRGRYCCDETHNAEERLLYICLHRPQMAVHIHEKFQASPFTFPLCTDCPQRVGTAKDNKPADKLVSDAHCISGIPTLPHANPWPIGWRVLMRPTTRTPPAPKADDSLPEKENALILQAALIDLCPIFVGGCGINFAEKHGAPRPAQSCPATFHIPDTRPLGSSDLPPAPCRSNQALHALYTNNEQTYSSQITSTLDGWLRAGARSETRPCANSIRCSCSRAIHLLVALQCPSLAAIW